MAAAEAAGDYCDARCVQVRIPISPGVHIEGVLRLPASDPVASLVVHGATATSSHFYSCLLYTSPSPRDQRGSRMPSSA